VDQFGFLHKIASGKDLNPNDAGIQAGNTAITAFIAKAESNLVKSLKASTTSSSSHGHFQKRS
jgi:hypothetical protein